MLCRGGEKIVTTVYPQLTNTDIYLSWNAFTPHSLKQGPLKTLSQRTYIICLTTELLDIELKHLGKLFVEKKLPEMGN